jgi:hypothetical protein
MAQKVQQQHDHEIMTEPEIAQLVRCHHRTLQRARLAGKPIFPFILVGDRPMYSRAAVLASFAGSAAS